MKALNKIVILGILAFSMSALAAPDRQWQQQLRGSVDRAVLSCGLHIWSGLDDRLPDQIRYRHVDDVIVKIEGGRSYPGILVDLRGPERSNEGDLVLEYMQRNGAFLLKIERDLQHNDIKIHHVRYGIMAFTRSYFQSGSGAAVKTRYYTQSRLGGGVSQVDRETFERFIFDAVDSFAASICDEAQSSDFDGSTLVL